MISKSTIYSVFITLFFVFCFQAFCPKAIFASENSSTAMLNGYESYRNKDWESAIIFLRQCVSDKNTESEEIWYMLIRSEANADEYQGVLSDCELFMKKYPSSIYSDMILYQKALACYNLEKYDDAISAFGAFCSSNEDNVLYPSALYWLAESFYAEYDYQTAKGLYQRIVSDFDDSTKKSDCLHRIQEISQQEREEKLLYLLKLTGEEYLSAKDEYERELKIYKNIDNDDLYGQIRKANKTISELQAKNAVLEKAAFDALQAVNKTILETNQIENKSESVEQNVELLKSKALYLQKLLNGD